MSKVKWTQDKYRRTVGGQRYTVSAHQARALEETFYSRKEMYADLGRNAYNVLAGLVTKGLFVETSGGWRRTAQGGRVLKALLNGGG